MWIAALLLLPSIWSACPDHPPPNHGSLVASPWQPDTLAIRWVLCQLLFWLAMLVFWLLQGVSMGWFPLPLELPTVLERSGLRYLTQLLTISMTIRWFLWIWWWLWSGERYDDYTAMKIYLACADNSENQDAVIDYSDCRLLTTVTPMYLKVLECGEAVALLVGGDEQSGWSALSHFSKN